MPDSPQTAERLSTVSALQVLDETVAASLDRITQLAAHALHMPVAFVSILGVERQRLVSRVGLDIASTDIRFAICSHAISRQTPLVIADLTKDERFAEHPFVTGGPQLRSYAGAPLVARNGVPIGAVCVMDHVPRELDAQERQHLATLADTVMAHLELRTLTGRLDPVSGLPNRNQFHLDYETNVARAEENDDLFAVMLDVMDVPRMNEAGQALGMPPLEAMMHRCGVRIRVALEDVAEVYHVGVSRFAFLLQRDAAVDVEDLVMELKQRVVRPILAAAIPMSPQFHAGICRVQRARDSSNDVLRKLLVGLQASITARSDFHWYSEQRDERLRRGYRLAADAERAMFRQEFSLHFQPRFDARTRAPIAAEALIRWTHPRLGPVSPGEFIPIFERTTIMPAVTRWVLNQALDELARWQSAGMALRLSVNLSPSDLDTAGAASMILDKLGERGIPADLLEVEVTEGEWVGENSLGAAQLALLAAAGVHVAIDDFGSGYSNFGYLTKLPISIIKIDKGLIDSVATHAASRLKVKAIVDLAAGLGYRTVAEGVETAEQAAVLSELGCDELQGFHLARPLPADALRAAVLRVAPGSVAS